MIRNTKHLKTLPLREFRSGLSKKYGILQQYRSGLYLMIIVSTASTFFAIFNLFKYLPKNLTEEIFISTVLLPIIMMLVTYLVGIISLFCLVKIIDFVFDLDNKD